MEGWIKVHRKLFKKAIWTKTTPEQKVILISLLMMANHSENEWEWHGKPFKAKPGQFVTSLESISTRCGKNVTVRKVRTAIDKFIKYGFLTNESSSDSRLITITNWASYQVDDDADDKQDDKLMTSDEQTIDNPLTTNKNANNDKNEKKCIHREL